MAIRPHTGKRLRPLVLERKSLESGGHRFLKNQSPFSGKEVYGHSVISQSVAGRLYASDSNDCHGRHGPGDGVKPRGPADDHAAVFVASAPGAIGHADGSAGYQQPEVDIAAGLVDDGYL